jgi:hypothetical protein
MSHANISSDTRDLARRLVAHEAAAEVSPMDKSSTCRVCEKLRRPLSTLIGSAGYRALLARAMTLAKREAPALAAVQVKEDASLDGLVGEAVQANAEIIAQLLELLTAFIGESQTLRLLHDIWPDLPGEEAFQGQGVE